MTAFFVPKLLYFFIISNLEMQDIDLVNFCWKLFKNWGLRETADIQRRKVILYNININMSLSNRKFFLKILIIACCALLSTSAPSKKISIHSVSLSAQQFIPAKGLERGGTVLYISGSGFNANGKGINVYLGPYECNVNSQESTKQMVVCQTSPMMKVKERQNLPITIYMVNSLPASCHSNNCLFSYVSSPTSKDAQEQRILTQNAPVLKLTCTGTAQYDNGGSVCADCGTVANSPGTANSAHTACNCNPTFVWNANADTCQCLANFILLNNKCNACAQLLNKYGTGKSTEDGLCECKQTFTFNPDKFACVCTDANTFVNSSSICFSCADITTNGTGLVASTGKACECKATFVWNAKLNDCLCPAGAVLGANQACFLCSQLKSKNGTGVLLNNNTCQCLPSFVWNPETNSCACPDPNSYIDKTSGRCVSCSQIGNSTNTANIAGRTCICQTSYIWNPKANSTACLCPIKESIILQNKTCFSCAALKGKNGTGLVNRTDPATCQCLKTFVWDSTANACVCQDPESFVNKATGLCFSCANITNGLGKADPVGKKCLCTDSTYIWTPTLKTPACVCPANSVVLNNSCFSCAGLKNKNGTGLTDPKNNTLCACQKTFVFSTDAGTCQCPDPESYIDKKLGCVPCSEVKNSTSTANKTGRTCICNPTYVWNPAASLKACLCLPNSIILGDQSCFSCASFKTKNGTGLVNKTDGKSCQCLKSFVFNTETNVCECPGPASFIDKATGLCVPCASLGNITGELNGTSKTCQCSQGFIWAPSISRKGCICPTNHYFLSQTVTCVNCNIVKSRNGTGLINKTNPTACECLKSFIYFNETNSCNCSNANSYIDPVTKLCVSCVGIGNGTGEANTTTNKCVCNHDSFIWSPKLKVPACICAPNSIVIDGQCFSCASNRARNLTGLVNISNNAACACLKSFVWNPTARACQCNDSNSYIDSKTGTCVPCSGIQNASDPAGADVVNRKCLCKATYVWVPTAKEPGCYCLPNSVVIGEECFSCTTLKGKSGTGLVSSTNSSACACLKSFVFNADNKACQCPLPNSFVDKATGLCISCDGVGNSTSNTISQSPQGCTCTQSFVWNSTRNTTACLCPALAIFNGEACFLCSTLTTPNATGRVNSTNKNLCQCSRSYVFNLETNQCECPNDANSFVNTARLCVSCLNVQYSTTNVNTTTGKACECNPNFVYSASLNKCLCQLPNKLSNGECVLPSALSSGNCPNDMQWDNQLQICVCQDGFAKRNSQCASCSAVENSNGKTGADRTSCQCKEGFNWSATSFSCQSA